MWLAFLQPGRVDPINSSRAIVPAWNCRHASRNRLEADVACFGARAGAPRMWRENGSASSSRLIAACPAALSSMRLIPRANLYEATFWSEEDHSAPVVFERALLIQKKWPHDETVS